MKNKPIDALNFKTGPTSSGITVNQEGARTIHEITEVQPTLAIRLEFPQYNYYTCHQENCEGRDYQSEEQGTCPYCNNRLEQGPFEYPEGTEINVSIISNYIISDTPIILNVYRIEHNQEPTQDHLLFQVQGRVTAEPPNYTGGNADFNYYICPREDCQHYDYESTRCPCGRELSERSESYLNYKAYEEGCDILFIVKVFENTEDEIEARSNRVRMQAFPWDKFDNFFNIVVNSGDVVYGPGYGTFEPQGEPLIYHRSAGTEPSETSPEDRWVVTSYHDKRGGSFYTCDSTGSGSSRQLIGTPTQVRTPSFVCGTFANFFLGYWFNYRDNFYTSWSASQQFCDEYDSNGRCFRVRGPFNIVGKEGVRTSSEDNPDKHGYREYMERRIVFTERNGSFQHVYEQRYRLGIINVVTYLRNGRHTMIIYKRNGRLYRMAADGDNINRSSEGTRPFPQYNYDIFVADRPIAHREYDSNWLRGNYVDAGQTNNMWIVWRVKPLREDGLAPQVGGLADDIQPVNRIVLEGS